MKHMPFFSNPMLKAPYPLWRGRLVLSLIGLALVGLDAVCAHSVALQGSLSDR